MVLLFYRGSECDIHQQIHTVTQGTTQTSVITLCRIQNHAAYSRTGTT